MEKVRFVTYNIDGLPSKIDLNDAPWYLRPIKWVYKLIKGTTEVRINDNDDRGPKTEEISKLLAAYDADVIGVQEDFNYHEELKSALNGYSTSTHTGPISFSNIGSLFPPRLKADGLNLITKDSTVKVLSEDIVKWNKSYGYVNHANDKLTTKGFRCYTISIYNNINIDIYILHMDADFYDPVGCPDILGDINARMSQLSQLLTYIQKKNSNNPIIIMGDTNSSPDFKWDVYNIDMLFKAGFKEATTECHSIDRLFYKGEGISVNNAFYGEGDLSDHRPFIVDIELQKK